VTPVPQERFADGVSHRLGWYVYVLVDPRSGLPFYVGKGKGERVFHHVAAAGRLDAETIVEGLKLRRICEIVESGGVVQHRILRHGFANSEEAFGYEAAVIDAYRLAGIEVANSVRGHGTERGFATVAELNASFGPIHDVTFDAPTALYRISPYNHNWSDDERYDRVRRAWPASEEARERLQVAAVVSDYVIQAVYLIDPSGWRPTELPKKWEWSRLQMPDDHPAQRLVRGSVRHLFENEKGKNKALVRMLYQGLKESRK
jgi:hypothetical protein